MDSGPLGHTGRQVGIPAGIVSMLWAVVGAVPMAGAAHFLSEAQRECSMVAGGGFLLAFACAGIGWILGLVGTLLGIGALRRGQAGTGAIGIGLNALLLVAPLVGLGLLGGE